MIHSISTSLMLIMVCVAEHGSFSNPSLVSMDPQSIIIDGKEVLLPPNPMKELHGHNIGAYGLDAVLMQNPAKLEDCDIYLPAWEAYIRLRPVIVNDLDGYVDFFYPCTK